MYTVDAGRITGRILVARDCVTKPRNAGSARFGAGALSVGVAEHPPAPALAGRGPELLFAEIAEVELEALASAGRACKLRKLGAVEGLPAGKREQDTVAGAGHLEDVQVVE